MKASFKLFLGALLVVSSAVAQQAETPSAPPSAPVIAGPAPKVVIESLEHQFGNVKPGTPLTYTFKVKNKGKGGLEIQSVTPSCGCTKGDFDKTVAPGKTGKITLTIAKTDHLSGPIVKTAGVATNDPEHKTLTLTLRANFSTQAAALTQTSAQAH